MVELGASDIRAMVGDGPLMLEIGCNDGTDTLEFLKAMPGIRLYCFEPEPRAIARFKQNVQDERVELIEAGVFDYDGTAVFYGSSGRAPREMVGPNPLACHELEEWDLSGSLCKPTGHLDYSTWVTFPEDRQYQVAVVKLDTWFAQHPEIEIIDFIWADVQGAEGQVIRGGLRALYQTRYLYTEYSDQPMYERQVSLKRISEMLPNFDFLKTCGDNALFRNPHPGKSRPR